MNNANTSRQVNTAHDARNAQLRGDAAAAQQALQTLDELGPRHELAQDVLDGRIDRDRALSRIGYGPREALILAAREARWEGRIRGRYASASIDRDGYLIATQCTLDDLRKVWPEGVRLALRLRKAAS